MSLETLVSEAEVIGMANAALENFELGSRNRLLVLVLFYSGARVSEVLSLRPCDLEKNKINIPWLKHNDPMRPRRNVGLPAWVEAELIEFKSQHHLADRAKFFPFSRVTAWNTMRRLGKRIGRDDIHPHLLRHSRAVDLMRKRADIGTVKAHLGHTSDSMTLRYLRFITDEDAARVVTGLGEKKPRELHD